MVAEGVFTTTNLESYCSVDDVLALLRAYDTSEWGSATELAAEVTALLEPTKAAVDSAAGRDFLLHCGQTVALDGTGTRVLLLSAAGLTPVVDVEAVQVNERTLDADEWLLYREEGAIVLAATSRLGRNFPEGRQNIQVTLDWGYEVTPADVAAAQARLIAAELVARWTGDGGGVEAVSLGDYTVRYGTDGRHAYTIRRLVAEAREAVARYRRLDFCAI
ncbi:MAG: hypothetical protein GX131_06365 [candidate division WS1 bacterium]|jgi:hypothetical protein|nr:hypothetical protein [candidate division WS1 bacterium]